MFFTDKAVSEIFLSWPVKGRPLGLDGQVALSESSTSADVVAVAKSSLQARKERFRDFGASFFRQEPGIGRLSLKEDAVVLTTPGGPMGFEPADPFTGQFVSEIRMPRPYWDTLTAEKLFDLLTHDANHLASHFGRKKGDRDRMLLRGILSPNTDGTSTLQARALLSDHFAFIDHDFAFAVVADHLASAGLTDWKLTVTPFSFYLDATGPFVGQDSLQTLDPSTQAALTNLGAIRIGWTLSNSEVGQGSMKIQPRIVIGDQTLTMEAEREKWIHRGSKLAFDPQTCRAIVESDEKLEDLQARVVASCTRVVSPEGFHPILAQIATAEAVEPKDPAMGFTRVSRMNEIANRLKKEDRDAILDLIAQRTATTNLTVLDVARAAADRAGAIQDRDHQADISEVAGLLVKLAGSSLWGAHHEA